MTDRRAHAGMFGTAVAPQSSLDRRVRWAVLAFLALSGASDAIGAPTPYVLGVVAVVYVAMIITTFNTSVGTLVTLAALACSIPGGFVPRMVMPVLLVSVLVAATSSLWLTLAFYGGVVVWLVVAVLHHDLNISGVVWLGLPTLIMAGVAAATFRNLARQRRADRLRITWLQEQATRAKADERRRLAGELHDIVAHNMTMVVMLSTMGSTLDDPERLRRTHARVEESARVALSDLRRLFEVLERSDVAQAPAGQATTTEDFGDSVRGAIANLTHLGFEVNCDEEGDTRQMPASLRHALRRSLQESLSNVAKYGDPRHPVRVDLTVTEDEVSLQVDNVPLRSRTTNAAGTGGAGLLHLKEQAEAYRGTCRVVDEHDRWSVHLMLPIRPTGA